MDKHLLLINSAISESLKVKQGILDNDELCKKINQAVGLIVVALNNGGRVLFCGNGGSAADAQHLAAELSGKFLLEREPLDAEALHVNTSFITAVANDHSYDEIFARLVKAKGRHGDVIVGLSTSGNSENIVRALKTAKSIGMNTIGLTGKQGGKMNAYSDIVIAIPSTSTPRIQEGHQLVGHIICELVEIACCKRSSTS